jgi:hypothetical protein
MCGAEAGIVYGGIAKRRDGSDDSSASCLKTANSHLFLFVALCWPLPHLGADCNTLITPDGSTPAINRQTGMAF